MSNSVCLIVKETFSEMRVYMVFRIKKMGYSSNFREDAVGILFQQESNKKEKV